MEYCSGPSLYEFIRKTPQFELHREVTLAQEILLGLKFLHSNGVVHGDLKTGNILLDVKKPTKICNFGLSAVQLDDVVACSERGTLQYLAPERLDGIVDEKGDVWRWVI